MSWMEIPLKINGFDVSARYKKEDIETIFYPLLHTLSAMQREKQKRLVVFLAAPPETGKSTLAAVLAQLSRNDDRLVTMQDIGLDGFHYPQAYIQTHTALIHGEKVPMKDVKGCPETFNIDKITKAIAQLENGNEAWPLYDRNLHDVVEHQLPIHEDIVLLEGNWLLLDEEKWRDLQAFCDYSIFIDAQAEMLKERLIQRKMKGGLSAAQAQAFYERSDGRNVERVLHHSLKADLTLHLQADLGFCKEERK